MTATRKRKKEIEEKLKDINKEITSFQSSSKEDIKTVSHLTR